MNKFTVTTLALLALAALAGIPTAQTDPPARRADDARWCRGNLVRNGDFSAGLVQVGNGSMPGSKVSNWTRAAGTPQVRADPGCGGRKGFISMWGNKVVGEAIQQKLQAPLLKGKTYRLSACVRRLKSPKPGPEYVRFRIRASNGSIGYKASGAPAIATIGIIGLSQSTPTAPSPGITSTAWTTYTLAEWESTGTYDTITINPENDNTANDGATVSRGHIDRVCLREVPGGKCPGNLVRNGDFSAGLVQVGNGSMPGSKVSNWTRAAGTPQVRADPGCGGRKGFISMWGNKVVGEAIQQKLQAPLLKGKTYRLSACVRRLKSPKPGPEYVRFRIRASNGSIGYKASGAPAIATIGIIGLSQSTPTAPSPGITSTAWTTYTLAEWKSTGTYDTITINPENDNTANDGATVSRGHIDRVCIQEVRRREPSPAAE